jgi:prephenate dehydratase
MTRPILPFAESAPRRLYALGPEGTFSDHAARRLRERLEAPGLPIVYTRTVAEALGKAEADAEGAAVIPIENSDAGTVIPAQDGLVRHRLTILAETSLRVRFSLLARGAPGLVRVLFAHPVAYDQCGDFVTSRLPQAQVTFTNSNTDSGARLLAASADDAVAAIVPIDVGQAHADLLVQSDIQNFANNTTRFLLVRLRRDPERHDFARAKTSVFIEPAEDRPGLLHALLTVFNNHRLNLCRLESRPDRVTPWKYVFFIDFNNNPASARCVEELLQTGHRITVLGSYDAVE